MQKKRTEKLTLNEYYRLKHEQEALEADYQDWEYRHYGGYDGDYWD